MKNAEILYRCDFDVYINDYFSFAVLFFECKVLKHTEKGCWVIGLDKKKRFVLYDSRKKYAYPTKEDAIIGYYHCRVHQIRHLESYLHHVRECKKLAIEKLKEMKIEY